MKKILALPHDHAAAALIDEPDDNAAANFVPASMRAVAGFKREVAFNSSDLSQLPDSLAMLN